MYLYNNAIQQRQLYTHVNMSNCSYYYNGDNKALSEEEGYPIYAADYEIFQVIFS